MHNPVADVALLPPLLHIPASIRHDIYLLAGLPQQVNLYLDAPQDARGFTQNGVTRNGIRQGGRSNLQWQSDEIRDGLPQVLALLMTCRAISSEVCHHLYAGNTFIVQDPLALKRLSPAALTSLTSLHVLLHHVQGFRFTHTCVAYFLPASKLWGQWTKNAESDMLLIDKWKEAVNLLGQHCPPGRLHLSLVCEVAFTEKELKGNPRESSASPAEQITSTFHDLPPLASFKLRLGSRRNKTLYETARRAALQATAQPEATQKPFRFLDLPTEIRLRILGFTDLVTPSNRIYWNLAKRYRMVFENRHPYNFCSAPYRAGCFCCREHAAYSPACRCWRDPQAFFLVSRAFLADARDVFYRHHHFNVGEFWQLSGSVLPSGDDWQYPATEFFTLGIPPQAVPVLRSLKISPFQVHRSADRKAARKTWMQTIGKIRQEGRERGDDGGLHLRFLRVSTPHLPHSEAFDNLRDAAPDQMLDVIRRIVHRRMWPLDDGDQLRLLPYGTRYLEVELRNSSIKVEYHLRPTVAVGGFVHELGEPAASRVLGRDVPGAEEWVEEAWISSDDPVLLDGPGRYVRGDYGSDPESDSDEE